MEFVLKRWMHTSAITRVKVNESFLNNINKGLSCWQEEDGAPCCVKTINELVKILETRGDSDDHLVYWYDEGEAGHEHFGAVVFEIAEDIMWDEDYEIYDSETDDWEFDVRED